MGGEGVRGEGGGGGRGRAIIYNDHLPYHCPFLHVPFYMEVTTIH